MYTCVPVQPPVGFGELAVSTSWIQGQEEQARGVVVGLAEYQWGPGKALALHGVLAVCGGDDGYSKEDQPLEGELKDSLHALFLFFLFPSLS